MKHIISQETELRVAVDAFSSGYALLADCEFVRERTFWAKLGLLQVRVGAQILLIDPLPLPASDAIRDLFSRAEVTVMHSPSEDLECLQHTFGWLPGRLFDTQLAAAFCGLGPGLSYRALVEHFAGVVLDKAETRSDWLARPLSEAQLRYAADDVLYLQDVHQALEALLDTSGKRAWFESDCAATLQRAHDAANAPPGVVLDARATQRLEPLARERLQCIFDWRDAEARRLDRPRSWIIDNEAAYALANATPNDETAHRRALDGAKHLAKHAPAALWEKLADVQAPDPATSPTPPRIEGNRFKSLLAQMQKQVASLAEQHQLPPGLLFPRKHLEALIDGEPWPQAARGWRQEMLEPRLRKLFPEMSSA